MDRKKRVFVYYMYVDRSPGENSVRISPKQMSNMGGRLLQYAVSRLYRIGADELAKKEGEYGKPYFCDHPEVHFNISHSGHIVMCAVSDFEVGVDVQIRKEGSVDLVARKVFAPDEYQKFLARTDREELFFRRWVMIESYLKWTGEGITRDLKGLYMDGWHQFIHVDRNYAACVWAGRPLDVVTVPVRPEHIDSHYRKV